MISMTPPRHVDSIFRKGFFSFVRSEHTTPIYRYEAEVAVLANTGDTLHGILFLLFLKISTYSVVAALGEPCPLLPNSGNGL